MEEIINQYDGSNRKHGFWKILFTNGNISYECYYNHGQLHGLAKLYFMTGILSEECQYKNGKRDGYSKHYCVDGSPHSIYKYVNGKKDGVFILNEYYGKHVITGTYIRGKRVLQKHYDTKIKKFPADVMQVEFNDNKLLQEIVIIR